VNRREFITLLGGAVIAWPLAARAQHSERVRLVGVLTNLAADDPEGQVRNTAFAQALAQLGWTVGQNLQIEHRWAAGDAERIRRYAVELVTLTPDVILATGAAGVAPLLQATRTVPVVFVLVPDPVGAGFVDSLARPGGNATGFVQFEYGISGKWLELLKEIAPGVTRVAVLRDPATTAGQGQIGAIQALAPSFGVEVTPINVRDAGEIEGDGPTLFAHACKMGLEGIVSKRKGSPYRSGRSRDWLKCKSPASEAVRREAEEDWGREKWR
jgi:putative ABC transport system substrate-binding protein